jgi:hypothetical protein
MNEIYRVSESEYHANYQQREKARELDSVRHGKLLKILSPAVLNAIDLEKAKFFKNARENFSLRAYESRY